MLALQLSNNQIVAVVAIVVAVIVLFVIVGHGNSEDRTRLDR